MKNDDSMIDDDALQPQGSPKIPLWVLSHYPRYVPLRLRSKLPKYGCTAVHVPGTRHYVRNTREASWPSMKVLGKILYLVS